MIKKLIDFICEIEINGRKFIESVNFTIAGKRIPCLMFIGIHLLVIIICYSVYASFLVTVGDQKESAKKVEERIFEAKCLLRETEYLANKTENLSEDAKRIVIECYDRLKEQDEIIMSLKSENRKLKENIRQPSKNKQFTKEDLESMFPGYTLY